jgi:hypothetical protein
MPCETLVKDLRKINLVQEQVTKIINVSKLPCFIVILSHLCGSYIPQEEEKTKTKKINKK